MRGEVRRVSLRHRSIWASAVVVVVVADGRGVDVEVAFCCDSAWALILISIGGARRRRRRVREDRSKRNRLTAAHRQQRRKRQASGSEEQIAEYEED